MKLKIFHIPALSPESAISDLNRFLAANQVAEVQKHFVPDGPNSFWSVWVSVTQHQESGFKPGKAKVDYKEVLNETDFALYAQLRELRKQMAASEGVPAYALFTNEQLALMVTRQVGSLAELGRIQGIGKSRLDKYGRAFVQLLQEAHIQ